MDMLSSPYSGFIGIIHVVAFIWALLQIFNSSMDGVSKILWVLVVGLFPVVGLIIYILFGRRV